MDARRAGDDAERLRARRVEPQRLAENIGHGCARLGRDQRRRRDIPLEPPPQRRDEIGAVVADARWSLGPPTLPHSSAARRVGKAWVSTRRYPCSPYRQKITNTN